MLFSIFFICFQRSLNALRLNGTFSREGCCTVSLSADNCRIHTKGWVSRTKDTHICLYGDTVVGQGRCLVRSFWTFYTSRLWILNEARFVGRVNRARVMAKWSWGMCESGGGISRRFTMAPSIFSCYLPKLMKVSEGQCKTPIMAFIILTGENICSRVMNSSKPQNYWWPHLQPLSRERARERKVSALLVVDSPHHHFPSGFWLTGNFPL